jgi:hypothetical protein
MVDIARRALIYAMGKYPNAHSSRHKSFSASVEELVTGDYKSDYGPTIRSHLVSWSLAGPKGTISATNTPEYGLITTLYPDGSLPRPGEWSYTEAIAHAEPIVFGVLGANAIKVIQQEGYFDDDPEDLKLLIKQVKTELALSSSDIYLDLLNKLKRKLSDAM